MNFFFVTDRFEYIKYFDWFEELVRKGKRPKKIVKHLDVLSNNHLDPIWIDLKK